MKIGILGGTGSMGSVFGARLARSGNDVALVDVAQRTIDHINRAGLKIDDKEGNTDTISIRATSEPDQVGPVDLLIVFVKCFHTGQAVANAASLIDENTQLLTLQNGWGNVRKLEKLVNAHQLIAGVTYVSATTIGPGHVKQLGKPLAYIGSPLGEITDPVRRIAAVLREAGFETTAAENIFDRIWAKLALNVCTLPTSALLQCTAERLVECREIEGLMKELLRETCAVAAARNIKLDFDENWVSISSLLKTAKGAKSSMYQDVEAKRKTEIDVINGAIVTEGQGCGVPTPYNQSMVWMVKGLESGY